MTNIERYRRRVLVADLAKQGTAPLDIAKRMGASVDCVMKIIRHGPDWQDHAPDEERQKSNSLEARKLHEIWFEVLPLPTSIKRSI
jgi:hypothetical protein